MYYAKIIDGIIKEYARVEDVKAGLVIVDYHDIIDYEPIQYHDTLYTQEKFAEIQATQEYKDEQEAINRGACEWEAKQLETEASYIQYKGKKISLQEILFKSLIYTSITDAYVYLKAEDGTLIKTLRATFLLIVAKAKSNLKAVEDALYNADNQFDPKKTLEENIAKIKGIFDAIDKIFNG